MVRILRAVTPRTFSARLARSRWKHSSPSADEESNGGGPSPPRIFEIVREQQPYPVRGRPGDSFKSPTFGAKINRLQTDIACANFPITCYDFLRQYFTRCTNQKAWVIFAKKWPCGAAGERLAWENTTLEKKLDRFFAQSELHKVMQSAFFLPFSVKKRPADLFLPKKNLSHLWSETRSAFVLGDFFCWSKDRLWWIR